jgi:hypothetical protein
MIVVIVTRERRTEREKTEAVVFGTGDVVCTWQDVVLAAALSGDWAELVERVREGLACRTSLVEAGGVLDPAEVTAEANDFRYARELLTVEETEAWLERWGLTVDQWIEYIERALLRRRSTSEPAARRDVAADDVADAIWAEAVCSGALARLARRLAGWVAAAASVEGPSHGCERNEGSEHDAALDGVLAEMAEQGLAGLVDAQQCRPRLEHLHELERRFARFRRRVVTPAAVRAAVQAHYLDWVRLRCQSVSFTDEQTAREAACCVRDDGEAFGAVARATRATISERWLSLDEMGPAARPILLSAESESLLGPLPELGEYMLVKIMEKVLPSADDPVVRTRAEEAVLSAAVEREVASRVRWEARL